MAAGDAHERPIYGCKWRVEFPLFDGVGDLVSSASDLDSEIIKDGASATDCTNEATEISSGVYGLELSAAEMSCKSAVLIIAASGAKPTLLSIYPVVPIVLASGTFASSGSTTTARLALSSIATDDIYNGLWLKCTSGTNAGEARRIIDYSATLRLATVESAFSGSTDGTYEIFTLDAVTVSGWLGRLASYGGAAGTPRVDVTSIDGSALSAVAMPSGGAPSATPSLVQAIMYLYKAWRNKTVQTATEYKLYSDGGGSLEQLASCSGNETQFERGQIGAPGGGP